VFIMKNLVSRHTFIAALLASVTALFSVDALAEIRFVRGQFTDRVERGQPVGDAAAARASGRITYHFTMSNSGPATTVTVVWKINGNTVRRQTLDIGSTPRWRTWASHRAGRTAQVSVDILDAEGHNLHSETLAP
jgi:hypothetical protein